MGMRERITIVTKSTTKTNTGAYISPSNVTVGTYWCSVGKNKSYPDMINTQNNIEQEVIFTIRNPTDVTFNKSHYIVYNGSEYVITSISPQEDYYRFIKFTTAKTD